MEYEVNRSANGKYMEVHLHVPFTVAVGRKFVPELLQPAREAGLTRFLLDVRGGPNKANTLELLKFIRDETKAMGAMEGFMGAFLVQRDDKSYNFVETVARNAGYIVKLFVDEQEASQWLSGDRES